MILTSFTLVYAHSGNLDNLGGHKDNENSNYHYHIGQYAGWIVNEKGDVPNLNKDIFDNSLIRDNSKPIITPINKTEKIFIDVDDTHWAFDAIKKCKENGIVNGYPDGSFKPNTPITRAELCYILANHYNIYDN